MRRWLRNEPARRYVGVPIPVETYGECTRLGCAYTGVLGNGLCADCWDRSSSNGITHNMGEAVK